MITNGSKLFQMVPNDSKWFQIVSNGSKWFQMVPKALNVLNCSKWFLMSIMTRICVLVYRVPFKLVQFLYLKILPGRTSNFEIYINIWLRLFQILVSYDSLRIWMYGGFGITLQRKYEVSSLYKEIPFFIKHECIDYNKHWKLQRNIQFLMNIPLSTGMFIER